MGTGNLSVGVIFLGGGAFLHKTAPKQPQIFQIYFDKVTLTNLYYP